MLPMARTRVFHADKFKLLCSAHLELVEAHPWAALGGQLPQDHTKAVHVTFCGHAPQLVVEALGRPERAREEWGSKSDGSKSGGRRVWKRGVWRCNET